MDSKSHYPVFVSWSEPDDSFLAVAPQLEGCIAHGSTRAEALENCELTISEWLLSAKELGWTVPKPLTTIQMAKSHQENEAQAQKEFIAAVHKSVMEIVQDVLIPQMTDQINALQSTHGQPSLEFSCESMALPRWSTNAPGQRQTILAGR